MEDKKLKEIIKKIKHWRNNLCSHKNYEIVSNKLEDFEEKNSLSLNDFEYIINSLLKIMDILQNILNVPKNSSINFNVELSEIQKICEDDIKQIIIKN